MYEVPLVRPVSVKLRAAASSRTGTPPSRATSKPVTSASVEGRPQVTVADRSPGAAATSVGAGAGSGTSARVIAVTPLSIATLTDAPRVCCTGWAPWTTWWTVMSRSSGKLSVTWAVGSGSAVRVTGSHTWASRHSSSTWLPSRFWVTR